MSVEAIEAQPDNFVQKHDDLIPLTSDEIHLWLTSPDEIDEPHLLTAYRALLNAAEKDQEMRFYFARDRHRYLVTRALVRTVLSRYIAVAPDEWMFSTNAYGRPQAVNKGATDCSLSFNISHTAGLIVLGVTKCRSLGVDVENIVRLNISIEIANRYFAPAEVTLLNAVLPEQQQYRFYEYWTFKESYIKARGMGLSLPLDKFSFHYSNDHTVELAIDPELEDDAARWEFCQFQPTSEHLLAVCVERIAAQSPRLIVRKGIPLKSEDKVTPKFLRISDSIGLQ
jgi:4'-phosphopantetheinyl transferase